MSTPERLTKDWTNPGTSIEEEAPIVLGRYRGRTPDRYVIGFGGATVAIYQPVGAAKPKEECQPFTFTFYKPHDEKDVKAQEKFTKGLGVLERKIIRERKARAKAAKS